jgi:high-affinity iron transporter
MLMQASMLLEQVDWLPSATAVWDSSGLISERSIAGELLYAVFGYEATPSALQLALYLSGLAVMALAWLAPRRLNSA